MPISGRVPELRITKKKIIKIPGPGKTQAIVGITNTACSIVHWKKKLPIVVVKLSN